MPRRAASFGTGGEATASFTNFIDTPNDAALQPDGNIVAAGELEVPGQPIGLLVARFLGS